MWGRRGIWRPTTEAGYRQALTLLYGGFVLCGIADLLRSLALWRAGSDDIIGAGLVLVCGPLCVRAFRRWRRELARHRLGLTPAADGDHLGERDERH